MPNNNAIIPVTRGGIIQPASQLTSFSVSRMEGAINHIAPATTVMSSCLPQRKRIPARIEFDAAAMKRPEVIYSQSPMSQGSVVRSVAGNAYHHNVDRDNISFCGSREALRVSSILAVCSGKNQQGAGKVKSIRMTTQRKREVWPGLDVFPTRQTWAAELNYSQQKLSRINISETSRAPNNALHMAYVNTGGNLLPHQSSSLTPASVTTPQSAYRGEGDQCEMYAQQQQRMVILSRGAEVYAQLPNLRPALELVKKVVGEVFRKIKNTEHVGEVMDAIAFCTGIRPEHVTFAIYHDFLQQVQSLLAQAGTYQPGEFNENQFAIVETPPGSIMAAATIPQDPHHRIWFSRNQSSASLAEFFKNVIHELCHMFTTVNPAFDFIYLIPQGCNEQEICDVDELHKALMNEVAYIGNNANVREAYFKNTMNMLGNSYPDAPLHHLFNATTSVEAAHSVEYNDWLRYVLVSRTSDLLSMLVIKLGYEKFLKNLPPQARSTADPASVMMKTEAIKDPASINFHLNTISSMMNEITTDFRSANGIMKALASIALPYPVETARWLNVRGGGLPVMMNRLYHHEPKNSAHVLGNINCILTWLMERGDLSASFVQKCILPIPYTYDFYNEKQSKEIWRDKLINCWVDLLRSYLRRFSVVPRQTEIEKLTRLLIRKSMNDKSVPGTVKFYQTLALELERRMKWMNHRDKDKAQQIDEPKRKKAKPTPAQPDRRLVNLAIKQRWFVAIEDEHGEFLRGFNATGERIPAQNVFDQQLATPIIEGSANILCVLREYEEDGQLYYHGIARNGTSIHCENDENNLSRAAMASWLGEVPTEEEVIMLGKALQTGEDNP